MIKKLSKMLVLTLMCAMVFMGTVHAADKSFSFTLVNTGQRYINFSKNYNKKEYSSDPWTVKVSTITCYGNYGMSFCPAKYVSGTTTACKSSAMWVNSRGTHYGKYASGDNSLVNYKLGVRQDDDFSTSFKASGTFNADKT